MVSPDPTQSNGHHTTGRPRPQNTASPAADVNNKVLSLFDDATERALLAAGFNRPECIREFRDVCRPEDFYEPRHVALCREMFAGLPQGAELLELRRRNALEACGGADYLQEIAGEFVSATSVGYWAARIAELSSRRKAADIGKNIIAGAADEATLDSVVASATHDLMGILPRHPDATPDHDQSREQFPVDALPLILADYVTAVAEALPCAPETVALPLLTAAATAIGNTRRIALKPSWAEPPVLWTATVLPSGKLKSPTHEKAVQFLTSRQKRLIKKYQAELREHEANVQAWEDSRAIRRREKAAESEPKPEPPVCGRYTTSDPTVEALADLLSQNPRGMMVDKDELAGWFGGFDRYTSGTGGDVPAYLSMHRAGNLIVDRKTGRRVTHIDRAAVCVAGTIQPAILRRCLRPEYFESGLPARMLLAMPDSPPRRWSEAIVPANIERATEDLFDALLNLKFESLLDSEGEEYQEPLTLPLSGEAKTLWVSFYNSHAVEQEGLADDRESSAFSKLEAYAARFALIFAVCREPNCTEVDAKSMSDGIRLTRWFCLETKRVYAMLGESAEDAEQNTLVRMIQDRFGGRVTARDLVQLSRLYRPTAKAETALEKLIAAHLGYWDIQTPTPSGGRPSAVFVLHQAPPAPAPTKPRKTEQNVGCVDVGAVGAPQKATSAPAAPVGVSPPPEPDNDQPPPPADDRDFAAGQPVEEVEL
ncbi:MAG: DUF3987 domain-containing protein [Phycisphaerales bacterium]|nr:DUF3987 domain-containing protein [Phycisphaerales bacterium]